jgi:hypothetical protein
MEVVIAAVVSAIVGPLIVAWFQRRDMKRRVGTPNGSGTLVQMTERLLAGHASLLEGQATQDARLGDVEGRVGRLERGQVTLAD